MLVNAENLFRKGYKHIVSVIPPGAGLTPASRVEKSHLGKAPGLRKHSGLWSGYNWRKHTPTLTDAVQWDRDGANVGIRADSFPAVDIDTMDAELARIIRNVALNVLGRAPIRVGNAPKQLLIYKTDEPFTRMRLWIDDKKHLVEVLGQGQQYLVAGTHPTTMKPYEWFGANGAPIVIPKATDLTRITKDGANKLIATLVNELGARGHTTQREGDGSPRSENSGVVQDELVAPSLDVLQQAVEKIPNDNNRFPERRDYLRMGYAIKAAAGKYDREGEAIFQQWAARWEGDEGSVGNDPVVVHADYARMHGPFIVGWPWIQEQAGVGAEDEFTVGVTP